MDSSTSHLQPMQHKKSVMEWFPASVSILILVAAIWLPVGIPRAGFIEEWEIYASFDKGLPFYTTPFFQLQPNRVLQYIPDYFTYLLTPGSFAGWNLILCLVLISKAFLFYGLIRRLFPGLPVFALLAGLLYVIYPADKAIVSMRTLVYHWAILFLLLSLNLLFIVDRRRRRSLWLALWIAQLTSLFTIESVLPIFLIAPLILLWARPRPLRDMISITVKWLVIPLAAAVVVLLTFIHPGSYQTSAYSAGTVTGGTQLLVYAVFIVLAEFRSFVHGWIEGLDLIRQILTSSLLIAGVISITGTVFSGFLQFRYVHWLPQEINRRAYMRIVVAGMLMVAAGFSPFLPLAQRSDFERTYLVASMGAVITVLMLLFVLSRFTAYPNFVFTVVGALVVGVALFAAQARYREQYDYSIEEQQILAQFVRQMPAFNDKAVVLIFDEGKSFRRTQWLFGSDYSGVILEAAMRFLYQNSNIHVWLCYPGESDSIVFLDRCDVGTDGIRLSSTTRPNETYPYSQLIVFSYDGSSDKMTLLEKLPAAYFGQLDTKTYNPDPLIDRLAASPARAKALLPTGGTEHDEITE